MKKLEDSVWKQYINPGGLFYAYWFLIQFFNFLADSLQIHEKHSARIFCNIHLFGFTRLLSGFWCCPESFAFTFINAFLLTLIADIFFLASPFHPLNNFNLFLAILSQIQFRYGNGNWVKKDGRKEQRKAFVDSYFKRRAAVEMRWDDGEKNEMTEMP